MLLFSWAGTASSRSNIEPTVPNRVTTAKRGPLYLSTKGKMPLEAKDVCPPPGPHSHLQKYQHSLTRFPVLMLQRPLEAIEQELGALSTTELRETLGEWTPQESTKILPPLLSTSHHRTKQRDSRPAISIEQRRHIGFNTPHQTHTSVAAQSHTKAVPPAPGTVHSHFNTRRNSMVHTPNLAPANMTAVVLHRLQPLNTSTIVKGQGLMTSKNNR